MAEDDVKQIAREIVAAHYDAKGWVTRAAAFRAGSIECADDVDLAVRAVKAGIVIAPAVLSQ